MRLRRQAKRFLLGLFYRKLWVEMAALLIPVVTISLIAMGVLLINTSQAAVRNSVLHEHKEIAERAAKEIGLFIRNPVNLLTATASMSSVVYPAPWKQETVLVESVLNQPLFMRILSVNLDGKVIASSEMGRESGFSYAEGILEAAGSGEVYLSGVKILDNNTPYITVSVPIKKMGRVEGALVADVNLRGMWDIVDNIRIGGTGRAFLVSDEGILIAHEDKKRVLRNEDLSDSEDVRLSLTGESGAMELEGEGKGGWISSYAPIPGLGWGIVLRQQQDEAYAFSKVMRRQSSIIILLSLLAAAAMSILMARTLVRPIKSLASRIKGAARGDLDTKLGIRRRDEIGELIRSFNNMTEKLKKAKARERLSAIGEAAAWIAHELKNSLVSIKSFVLLFPRKHNDKKFVDRFSRLIPDELERWEKMLKDLSGFSSQLELMISDIDIKGLIRGILEMMKESFTEKKIIVRYNPPEYNHNIAADPEKLKQVFSNLFINAANAMAGGGILTVSLDFISGKGSTGPEYVKVKIEDTGKGIPADMLTEIFEPFHTTKREGMGLGLAISRRIIEQHGGDIDVKSRVGIGTVFTVRLPAGDRYEG